LIKFTLKGTDALYQFTIKELEGIVLPYKIRDEINEINNDYKNLKNDFSRTKKEYDFFLNEVCDIKILTDKNILLRREGVKDLAFDEDKLASLLVFDEEFIKQ
jgi:hypothetical protein